MDFQPQPHPSIVNIDSHISTTASSHISGDDDAERSNHQDYGQDVFSDLGATAESMFPDTDHIQHHRFAPTAAPKLLPAYVPADRRLPPREVSDETIDDAYVDFILYCNPQVALSTDTEELRRIFRQLPKSDGKTFNIIHLLDLIRKLEEKEIKTWTKLAIDLGVERTEEQSAQKVQQYAVRLKRWMHAMHIDAFFAYCLGKPHTYYTQIPLPNNPNAAWEERDGVPPEEDLALRALHPESRPKRGRRKTEDKDHGEIDLNTAKRHHMGEHLQDPFINHNTMFEAHAALGDGSESDSIGQFMDGQIHSDPWNVGGDQNTQNNAQFRQWRAFPGDSHDALCSPGGLSHTSNPHDDQSPLTSINIPTPTPATKPRPRRRHGPAVSSAWPSSSNSLTGKMRGRPPSNRSTRDGPFSSFPVNPPVRSNSTPVDSINSSLMSNSIMPATGHFTFSHIRTPTSPSLQMLPDRSHSSINIQAPQMMRSMTDHGDGSTQGRESDDDILRGLESMILDNLLHPGYFSEQSISLATAKVLAQRITEEIRRIDQPVFGERKEHYLTTVNMLLEHQNELKVTRIQSHPSTDESAFQSLAGIDLHDQAEQRRKATYNLKWTICLPPFNGEVSMNICIDDPDKHQDYSRIMEDNHLMAVDNMADDTGLVGQSGPVSLAAQRKIEDLEKKLREKDEMIMNMRRIMMEALQVGGGVLPT